MTHDVAALLAAGEQAAFHGRPAAGLDPLRRVTASPDSDPAEVAAAGWLLGVCLSATGRYGAALAALGPVLDGTGRPARRVLAALAAATVASVHRQLGRHAEAQGYDEQALAGSGGTGEAGFDALLGLAADAVGMGDRHRAADRLRDAAAVAAGRPDWWRQRVRLGWVRAELALLTGEADRADAAASEAVVLAEAAGAPRHVAKGLLFGGVAQVQRGRPAHATATLRRAALLAEGLGTLPVLWPARAMLGALVYEDDPVAAERALAAARAAVDTIAADLPAPLRADWLARPDVEALRAS